MVKDNQGFSLVELMIGAAILGGLALGFSSIMGNMTKSNVKAQSDSEVLLAYNEIVSILSNPANCLSSLGGKNVVNDVSVTKLKFKSVDKFTVGVGFGNNNTKIMSYKIDGYNASTSTANLTVSFEKKKILGAGNLSKSISLHVTVDGSNLITSCGSLASAGSEIWTRDTAMPTSIFYNGGDVGIGTTNPVTKLDVAGGVKFGNETQVTVCNSANEGVQRYNKSSHSFEYCAYKAGPPVTYYWAVMGGGIGVNQEWKRYDPSGGRIFNQPYSNNTGKPIEVSVTVNGKYPNSLGYWGFSGFVSDQYGSYQGIIYQVSHHTSENRFGSTGTMSATFIVPPNRSYQVAPLPHDGSTTSLMYWYEMR